MGDGRRIRESDDESERSPKSLGEFDALRGFRVFSAPRLHSAAWCAPCCGEVTGGLECATKRA